MSLLPHVCLDIICISISNVFKRGVALNAYLSIDLLKKQMYTLISLLLCSQVIGCSSSELSTFTPYSTGGVEVGGDQGHGGGVSGGDQGHGGGMNGGDQGDGGGVEVGGETSPPPPFIPSPPTWTRLTSKQYQNTILDIFGVDVQRNHIEPDTNPHLFYSIGASSTSISSQGVDQYGEVAYFVADTFVQNSARIEADLNCLPEAINDGCVQQLIRTFGGRLYRRPLTEEEANRWLALSSRFAEGQWRRGVATVIAGLLQSPLRRPRAALP